MDPARIADVYFGNANGVGEENRDVGRMAALLVGLPTSAPGMTVDRLCATGLDAVVQAARALAVAGGVELKHDGMRGGGACVPRSTLGEQAPG